MCCLAAIFFEDPFRSSMVGLRHNPRRGRDLRKRDSLCQRRSKDLVWRQKYIYFFIIHSFIHSKIYKAPLQEIYLEAPPAQPRRYRSVLSNLQNALSLFFGRRRISKWESIPGGGGNNGERATLPSCSFNMRHHLLASNRVTEESIMHIKTKIILSIVIFDLLLRCVYSADVTSTK